MKRSGVVLGILLLTGLGALGGAGLRVYQLTSCMTPAGLIRPGDPILYLLLGFALLCMVGAGLLCFRTNRVRGGEDCLVGSPVLLFFDLAAAIAIFFGSLLRLAEGTSTVKELFERLVMQQPVELFLYLLCLGGMLSAGCLAAAALLYGKGSRLTFWLLFLPCVFLAANLIYSFKDWSTDPLVLDFCFLLLAQVCGLLGLFHLAGFPLGFGSKRMSIFWAIGTVLFTATSLPDRLLRGTPALGELLLLIGLALFCGTHAVRLLRTPVQDAAPPEAEDAPTPAEAETPAEPEAIPAEASDAETAPKPDDPEAAQ